MRHPFMKRIGPGDLWQCQEPECQDKGPYLELTSRPCKRATDLTKEEQDGNLLDAIGADARTGIQNEIDEHDREVFGS